jgi:hypothetical protein
MNAARIALFAGLLLLAGGCTNKLGLPIDAELPFPKIGKVAAEEEPIETKSRQETQRELDEMDELAETHAEKAKQEIEGRN